MPTKQMLEDENARLKAALGALVDSEEVDESDSDDVDDDADMDDG